MARPAAPEWTQAPRVLAVIHGTRVCKRAAFRRDSGGEAKSSSMAVKTTRPRGGTQCCLVYLDTEGVAKENTAVSL